MSQSGQPGRGKRRGVQAPFGSNLGFGNASQQGVESSLVGLETAFPPDPSTIGNPGTISAQDPILNQSISTIGDPGTISATDPIFNQQSTIGDPGTISVSDPIFDLGGPGVEQLLGQFPGLGEFPGLGVFPGQGLGQRRVRGRPGTRGGK